MHWTGFHPALATWFARELGTPTEVQARAWPAIAAGRDTLIAAPTGSGKTLAAFFAVLNDLVQRGPGTLEGTQVVYVSPLKALSNDIHKNLMQPLAGVQDERTRLGEAGAPIRAALRTGDTSARERQALPKNPPHILVTTPESLYLLLTSESGQRMLSTTRTVIIDEIHALVGTKRGSHLALSLERLQALAKQPLVRVGLSATQNPIEEVARFLVGSTRIDADGSPRCDIIDVGHKRKMDLAIELPRSPLEAVMSGEVWGEIHERLCELILTHKTTLIFVNTRRMAERITHSLAERIGEDAITSHHGSLSAKLRHNAEQRLKAGELRALVATASLELGIDIGSVDLVCQLGTTRSIAGLLQRVGRSGHQLAGTPKGRLFPLSRDELAEAVALFRAVNSGALDKVEIPDAPLDILAQQLVATSAGEDWDEDALFNMTRAAYPYRNVSRDSFDKVLAMLADGFSTRRGRRGAHVHHDPVNKRVRGRRGARIAALTSGGAIPDNADYRVVQDPTETFVGTINEDFAIESMPGDIFLLGNTSWRILRVENGRVRVEDAKGEPPTLPFWLGEAPARTRELSQALSELRREWPLASVDGASPEALTQLRDYYAVATESLGTLPTHETVIAERFFDESGGMQLVLHAPFGGRINRAWGLALRKCFCRTFNFELQAAATEDAIVLSLGAQHSFPLEDVFKFLKPNTVRDVLVQALLDAPMFQTRWRWNAGRSLALLRQRGGKRVPPNIQRMEAEDLVAAVFPDQLACLENIVGERQIPDHPLVTQTITDCLVEAMDIDGLEDVLTRIGNGSIQCIARDLPEPSVLSHEVLSARPYAFLDDAPLEERRTRAVLTRRATQPSDVRALGALDANAISLISAQVFPAPRDADEMADALSDLGVLTSQELATKPEWLAYLQALEATRRASRITLGDNEVWVGANRRDELAALHPTLGTDRKLDPGEALRELCRGRLECSGPVTSDALARVFAVSTSDIDIALFALEAEGFVLRGQFTGHAPLEWCERRVLARIHRQTVQRLRAEIEPVSQSDFMRFLLRWQRIDGDRPRGRDGLLTVLHVLDGFEAPASVIEPELLAARVADYDPTWLDDLCLRGHFGWGRLRPRGTPTTERPSFAHVRQSPTTLFLRDHLDTHLSLASHEPPALSPNATRLKETLTQRGALFFSELVRTTGLSFSEGEEALYELIAQGQVTADSFAALRMLLLPMQERAVLQMTRGKARSVFDSAGRWSLLQSFGSEHDPIEAQARMYLARYGVVFRALLLGETNAPPWRELLRVYRTLEARGELRGGHFVNGPSGEQFALPEALGLVRSVRREAKEGALVVISAADPANLVGTVLPGRRTPNQGQNRILLCDGEPVFALESGDVIPLTSTPPLDIGLARSVLSKVGPTRVRAATQVSA